MGDTFQRETSLARYFPGLAKAYIYLRRLLAKSVDLEVNHSQASAQWLLIYQAGIPRASTQDIRNYCSLLICSTVSASLESRFFVDDGLWRNAPLLTGHGSFDPLPEVRNILVTGGEGFM